MTELTRKERLLVAIWEAWRDERPQTVADLARAAGYAGKGSIAYSTFERQGWIVRTGVPNWPVIPGPRFGGVDRATGRPLYVLFAGDELAGRRLPKYERRGVLFEVR